MSDPGASRPTDATAAATMTNLSEQVLAPWLDRHRDEVLVATKVRFPVTDPGGSGLAPARLNQDSGPRRAKARAHE